MRALHDLALGMRFAVSGGREGRLRTGLTALGVGLGVALLLAASSVPSIIDGRMARTDARGVAATHSGGVARSDTSFLYIDASTEFHGRPVSGTLLRADGAHATPPPGVAAVPRPGDMVVSPALRDLMNAPGGTLLRRRLPFHDAGTVAGAGLLDPGELVYYAGDSDLSTDRGAHRASAYGSDDARDPLDPMLIAVIALICVVLLVPVIVFIATAVRFGGERRDRRLAVLRLVGADARATRRMAAGEALFGAGAGLAAGGAIFAVARHFAGSIRLWGMSAFPADVTPVPLLAALVVVAVLATSVGAALFALRSVSIEPLGVVREAEPRARRLWWRLAAPAAGIATLVLTHRFAGKNAALHTVPIIVGAALTLIGLVGLLPWLVEKAVVRLRGGPVPWQLATRRLQLSGGSASRAVGGITVAVAGAILLQMVFGGIQDDFAHPDDSTGAVPTSSAHRHGAPREADVTVQVSAGDMGLARRLATSLGSTRGVSGVAATVEAYATPLAGTSARPGQGGGAITTVTVGDCASLRAFARIPSCHDGDTFVSRTSAATAVDDRPGEVVALDSGDGGHGASAARFTVPYSARTVRALPGWQGESHAGVLATPAALDASTIGGAVTWARVWTDGGRSPGTVERVRTAAALADPAARVDTWVDEARDRQYASVQTGLKIGGTATMALIAAGLLVSAIEQLRERRRLLAVLVAFGTRRSTLAWSVLWQTAVPVVVGTVLAVVGGVALGKVTLDLLAEPVGSWWVFWPYASMGAAVILLVTLACMPPLWRLMRPDGLHTE
ncbi:ABC transporter permease [Streptomyces montanisoli]|uniref:ABC transporter permease n=1 Tax=Streptomyces montanisoli TaxID=2798581 RepID=A0A940MBG8_9ACTN|nr:FtsX-like permease family protein [Streptomyces montanisoli]MBP0458224.1 ABC transporter permease [Streptomyces montanisoli]